MMGFNTQSDMIVEPRRSHAVPDHRQPVPRRLQPAARQLARRVHQPGPGHRRRHRRRVHDEPGAAHAAVERQRAARAAGQHHHRGRLHRQPRHRPADRRERAGVRTGRSVVPRPRHRRCRTRCRIRSSGSSPTRRRRCASRPSHATACCGRIPQYDGVTAFRVPGAKSIYHGVTLRADKRFAKGLSLLASYTGGKLKDDASTTVGFLGQAGTSRTPTIVRGDYSLSSNDVRVSPRQRLRLRPAVRREPAVRRRPAAGPSAG